MRKWLLFLTVPLLALTLVSCSTISGSTTSEKPVILSVSNDRENEQAVLSGEKIVFSLDTELPEGVTETDIVWFVNGEKVNQTGSSITVVTDKDVNLQYSAHVEIDTPAFRAMSNFSRCIAVTDLEYSELANAVYKFVEETRTEYNVEDIPGVSVSIYGRNGDLDFDLYDGYSSVTRNIKNTEETMHLVGSISKPLVAASFFKLMLEEGSTLSMNQTLGDYLTEDDLDPDHTGKVMSKISLDCTLASLFNHTSGIGDFFGTEYILDLVYRDKDSLFYNLLGFILNKKAPQDPYKDGWAPYKILPYITSDFNPDRGYEYSTVGYVILGMVVEKYLNQVHPGVSLSSYINENFILPYCDTPVLLLASDFDNDSDYEIVADPNVYQSELDYLIQSYTDLDPKLVKFLGINKEGRNIFNLREFSEHYNISIAQSSWTGGGFAANAHQISRFGYNLFGIYVEDPTNSEVRELIDKDLGTDDFVNDRTYCYFRKNLRENSESPDIYMYGHNGKTVSTSNIMLYDPEADICIAIFVDSNAPENKFYNLLREIHGIYTTK